MTCLEEENYLIQIRSALRQDEIKLWLPPYIKNSSEPSTEDLMTLSNRYGSSMNLPPEICYDILLELQNNALENLKQKNLFLETGLITLKVKVVQQNNPPKIVVKEVHPSVTGANFKRIINEAINNCNNEKLKVIHAGKILKDEDTLQSQGVKNGQQVLAIVLSESVEKIAEAEEQVKEVENFKNDTKLLALDNDYMQLEDQFGNIVQIPPKEKKSLIIAMSLYEKGKAALKKKDCSRALILFLEADQEFKQCNSKLLETVDNYALLDLDIAWCYLCLESFLHLPDAKERLNRCEKQLYTTYGDNLERVIAVKGTADNEQALLMKLHVLQAIILYYQNNRVEALQLLKRVEGKLNNLKVDETSVATLVEFGYSKSEATIGLRVSQGDITGAANYIDEDREKKTKARKNAQAAEKLEKEKQKLGLCADGNQYVDPNLLKSLVNMGYNREIARLALQKTNNVISDSIEYIQEHPGPSNMDNTDILTLVNNFLPDLEAAGFDHEMAKSALEKNKGDVTKAAEELLLNNGINFGDFQSSTAVEGLKKIKDMYKDKKYEAFQRLKEDISDNEFDYLDVDLVEIEIFLMRYLSLLEK